MKKITAADVAEYAGVSRATVSYVLNNRKDKRISKETRDRILDAADKLNYRPNPFARSLKVRSAKSVILVMPNLTDASLPVLIKGVETAANLSDYSLMIYDLESKGNNKLEAVSFLCDRPIDGMIYAYPEESDGCILDFLVNKRKIPTVVIEERCEEIKLNCVRSDHYAAGRQVAHHFWSLGHKRCAVVAGNPATRRKRRMQGFVDEMQERKCNVTTIRGRSVNSSPSFFYNKREYDKGFLTAVNLAEQGFDFTAIWGINSMIAIGLVNGFKSKGIKVPADVSIAACGEFFVTEIIDPKMTTVSRPTYDMGKTAFKVLESVLTGERRAATQDIVFDYKLIVRDSTRQI